MTTAALGPWVERWLSHERFATYLTAAAGVRAAALDLYEWNVRVSGALLHDLAHLEVGLRNSYDRALSAGSPTPWTDPGSPLFAPLPQKRGGVRVDINERFRQQLDDARANAVRSVGATAGHGDVVAQLGFGFWRYLTSKGHEKTLWVPLLHAAYPPGTDRARDVDARLVRLNKIRNRVAHHEPLLHADLPRRVDDIVALATMLDSELGGYVRRMSEVASHVAARPTR